MTSIQRVKTGIPAYRGYPNGLDDLLEGGIPLNNVVLVTGPTGSGKSLHSMQYLINGANEGERGLYISFEQTREDILKLDTVFNWNLGELVEQDMIRIISHRVTEDQPSSVLKNLEDLLSYYQPKRLVFDSISTYVVYMEIVGYVELVMDYGLEDKKYIKISPDMAMRKTIMRLIEALKGTEVTALLISERPETGGYLSRDTISEFLVDGILTLNFIGVGGEQFGDLQVRKMRNTKHARNPFMTHITEEGLTIGEETVDLMR